MNRAVATTILNSYGIIVQEAENGQAAIDSLKENRYDLILMDVVMPGMDGPSWVRKALIDRPNVKVIFVSGYAEDSLAENQARIPNSVFLPKPFSLNDLAATVQGQMH